jgi:glycosyltransferase involved in cell wall biosynthesis
LRQIEIVVVVPCYNEAKRLELRTFGEFIAAHPNVTLIFVDDGSTDDTPLVMERLRQQHSRQVCTLRLGTNVGKAEAVRRGMCNALRRRPAIVGYWDADLATPLESILSLADVLQTRVNVELVMGSRVALLGREIRRSGVRHFAGRVFATLASLALGVPVYDTQCGAKLFRVTPIFAEIMSRPFRSRWIFDVEILARLLASQRREGHDQGSGFIYEYPLEKWCDVQNSRLKSIDFAVAAIDLLSIFREHRQGSGTRQVASVQPHNEGLPDEDPNRRAA